jgi:flagellar biosynthesis GTPase FlhF
MWGSIYRLPVSIEHFWDAHFINKAQILFLLFLLYLFGYYSSKLLVNRNILKWGIFIFFFLPFLASIFHSKQIIFIFPVVIGILKGFFIGNSGFNPFGAFEGIMDFFLSVRQRRGHAELHQKYEEAEEIIRKAKEYEKQSRSSAQDKANAKEQFKEEMKRERERQEQEAKRKSQNSSSDKSDTHSEKRNQNESTKPKQEAETDTRDPREVLGLGAEFTQAELKKARNAALMRCHSDKWADKPKSVQKIMEEETKKINWAYEKLK